MSVIDPQPDPPESEGGGGGGEGVSVHGLLSGRSVSGQHPIGAITSLQATLDGKQPLSAVLTATTASFTTADETKLDGVEAGATTDMTAAELLTAIKTVDGTGSGLDADLLDGNSSAAFETPAGAQAKVDTHVSDTTSVHGITDTTLLETTTGAQAKVDAHVNDGTDAHDASAVSFTPAGTIVATNVQAAITEVAAETAAELVAADPTELGLAEAGGVVTATILPTIARRDQTIVAESGTTHTLTLTDNGALIRCTHASGCTITLPQDSDVALPVGARGQFLAVTGAVSTVLGTGAAGTLTTAPAGTVGEWVKVAADTFSTFSAAGYAQIYDAILMSNINAARVSKVVGQYYQDLGTAGTTATAPSLNRLMLWPTYKAAGTLDRLGCEVSTLEATSVIRAGIWTHDLSTNLPTTLIAECTSGADTYPFDASGTGNKNGAISATLPTTGIYWYSLVVQVASSAVRLRTVSGPVQYAPPLGTSPPSTGANVSHIRHVSSISGALSTASPIGAPGTGETLTPPRMFYRYSA